MDKFLFICMTNKNISQLKSLKAKSKREADLFFSLCENGQDFVESNKLKDALNNSGLKPSDNRLQSLFKRLDAHGDKIVFEDFISIIRTSGLLVEKALRGQLALPDFSDFSKNIDKIFEEVKEGAMQVEEIDDVDLQLVWDPPWTKDMMSDAAKLELNL